MRQETLDLGGYDKIADRPYRGIVWGGHDRINRTRLRQRLIDLAATLAWIAAIYLMAAIVFGCLFAAAALDVYGVEQSIVAKPPAGITLPVKVIEVVDGDTITVEWTYRCRVRLRNAWAPETRTTDAVEKKAGLAAKLHLSALAIGKRALLHVDTRAAQRVGDVFTFDRIVGDVWLEGDDVTLAQRQVAAKHASRAKGGLLGH